MNDSISAPTKESATGHESGIVEIGVQFDDAGVMAAFVAFVTTAIKSFGGKGDVSISTMTHFQTGQTEKVEPEPAGQASDLNDLNPPAAEPAPAPRASIMTVPGVVAASQPISKLNLPTRILTRLEGAGYKSIHALSDDIDEGNLKIPGLAKQSIDQISEAIDRFNHGYKIEELGSFKDKSIDSMKDNGIHGSLDLVLFTESELYACGFSEHIVKKLIAGLAKFGLQLKPEPDSDHKVGATI